MKIPEKDFVQGEYLYGYRYRHKREQLKGKEIVQHNVFYKRGAGRSRNSQLESAETRRAAGISIREN